MGSQPEEKCMCKLYAHALVFRCVVPRHHLVSLSLMCIELTHALVFTAGSAARPRPLQRFCTDGLLRIRPGLVCA
jgi:hypothetical protein